MKNKDLIKLTWISFLSYAFIGALVTMTGLIIQSLSKQFNISITQASNIFNFLNFGILISIFLHAWFIELLSLKKQLFFGFIIIFFTTIILILTNNLIIFSCSIFIFGFISGITLSIGTFLITHLYHEESRLEKMLIMDSFFSISGTIFPIINIFFTSYHIKPKYIYCLINFIYFTIFFISQYIKFPKFIIKKEKDNQKNFTINTTLLYFSALIYILGQLGFISWVPEYSSKYMHIKIEQSGKIISSFWISYMIGMWFFSYFLKFFNLKKSIIYISGLSTIIMFCFIQNTNYIFSLILISLLGFFSSSIYSSIIILSSIQTKNPSPKIINLTLFSGTIGTLLTFIITSPIVKYKGVKFSLIISNILYFIVFLIFIVLYFLSKNSYKKILKK
ncbi:MFS transporter TsgA [Buchnera aphidicola]|uniref:MFS transporter TsgA n=1 Tax=Buchnera aphidicola TaxID=9 RepID=UPI003464A626